MPYRCDDSVKSTIIVRTFDIQQRLPMMPGNWTDVTRPMTLMWRVLTVLMRIPDTFFELGYKHQSFEASKAEQDIKKCQNVHAVSRR